MNSYLQALKPGDKVVRRMGESAEMPLYVSEVTENLIVCGPWTFSRRTGLEIDDEIGWTAEDSGSRILIP